MPATYFISDLHLSETEPRTALLFANFLKLLKPNDTLYILGDFFDYWINSPKDKINNFQSKILNQLKDKASNNIKIYFMPGNRDFLLKKNTLIKFNINYLPNEPTIININNKNILLAHGDQWCTDDHSYQRYKKIVSNKWVQKLFFSLPKFIRDKIGQKIRQKSASHQKEQTKPIDVTDEAILNAIEIYKDKSCVNYIIHGHTHRFGTHDHGQTKRLVLGDWHKSGSFIKITDNSKPSLHRFNS